MIPDHARSAAVAAVIASAACTSAEVAGNQDCDPKPRDFQPGAVVVLDDAPAATCTIVFEPTGVELRASDGSRPDPGSRVVRDSRGILYSANAPGFGGVVAVWDSAGNYLRTIGGPGEGPGELSTRGAMVLRMDSQDRLHVRDGGISWNVFSPRFEFLRKVPWQGGTSNGAVVLDDGTVLQLTGTNAGGEVSHFFEVRDIGLSGGTVSAAERSGATDALEPPTPVLSTQVRSFAEIDPALRATSPYTPRRAIAYAGGSTVWAGPAEGDGRGYVLEEWSTAGERLRTFRRDVEWFPATGAVGRPERTEKPPPQLEMMHIDSDGLLITLIGVANDDWRYVEGVVDDEEEENMYDGIVEVIDTRSATVIVSERMPVTEAIARIPRGFFAGQASGYRVEETPEGLPVVKIVDYRVVPR